MRLTSTDNASGILKGGRWSDTTHKENIYSVFIFYFLLKILYKKNVMVRTETHAQNFALHPRGHVDCRTDTYALPPPTIFIFFRADPVYQMY